MSDLDRTKKRIVLGLLGATALVVAVFWFAGGDEQSEPSSMETATKISETSRSAPVPASAPTRERPPLPRLGRSDSLVGEEVTALAGRGAARRWLPESDRISKLMTVIDNMAAGKIALRELRHAKPKQDFGVRKVGGELYMDPRSYRRFNPMIEAITRVEPAQAAELYRYLRPLMQRAHRQLGYDADDMDDKLMMAIDRMLKAPVRRKPLRLVRPSVSYRYADPELEKMDALTKQMFRLGPDNTRRLQSWLEQLKPLLR